MARGVDFAPVRIQPWFRRQLRSAVGSRGNAVARAITDTLAVHLLDEASVARLLDNCEHLIGASARWRTRFCARARTSAFLRPAGSGYRSPGKRSLIPSLQPAGTRALDRSGEHCRSRGRSAVRGSARLVKSTFALTASIRLLSQTSATARGDPSGDSELAASARQRSCRWNRSRPDWTIDLDCDRR